DAHRSVLRGREAEVARSSVLRALCARHERLRAYTQRVAGRWRGGHPRHERTAVDSRTHIARLHPHARWRHHAPVAHHLGRHADRNRVSARRKHSGPPEGGPCAKNRRRPTLPGPRGPSTIGAEGLNCSVRNGKRCFPLAIRHRKFGETTAPAELENCTKPQGNKYPSSPRRISTARLSALLRVHRRPINLVVSQASYSLKGMGELISRSASRLDAF